MYDKKIVEDLKDSVRADLQRVYDDEDTYNCEDFIETIRGYIADLPEEIVEEDEYVSRLNEMLQEAETEEQYHASQFVTDVDDITVNGGWDDEV